MSASPTPPASSEEAHDHRYMLNRYRTLMVTIGVVYPAWRFMAYFYESGVNESWEQRGLIGVLFLSIALLTFRFEYFRRNVATYFNTITYAWAMQTAYLIMVNEMESDYLMMGMVVIFTVGGSFLDLNTMMWYYLCCLVLTGTMVLKSPTGEHINFFCGVLTALCVSYVAMASLMRLFRELRKSKAALQSRTDEFLALSSAVQTLFLPAKDSIKSENFNLAGFYRPVDGCGGDWWSYFENGNRLTILTGDVTGHGPGPAMMTASIASYTRALQSERPDLSIENILRALNKYLLELQGEKSGKYRYLMTVHALEIDFDKREIKSWAAGAPEAAILGTDQSIEFIGKSGTPLGLNLELHLGVDARVMKSGDRILLFTDGIMEIEIAGRRISDRKILKFAASDRALEPLPAANALISRLDKMRGTVPQEDDYTLVLLDVA